MRTLLLGLLSRMRFPWLFAATAILFVASLLIPDPVPFVDELLLALVTLLFGAWRKRKDVPSAESTPAP